MSAMSKPSSSSSARDEITALETATMGVQSEKRHFTCRLERVTKLLECDLLIDAQKFHFKMGDSIGLPTTWTFYLKKDGDTKAIETYFNLVKKPGLVKHVYASYKVIIKKPNGSIFFRGAAEKCKKMNEDDGSNWGFGNVISPDANLTDVVHADGSLLIEVDFELFVDLGVVAVCEDLAGKVKAFEGKSIEQLSKDMLQTLTREDVDVNAVTMIISKDNVEFPVNRGVLAARGKVFQLMFQAEMSESVTGVVRIDDLSGKTVKVLLHYVCSGTLHQDWSSPDVIEELTSAAHRYELHILTGFLDDVLGIVCTKDNAMRLAVLSKTLGMKKAEMDLVAFVKRNAANLEDLMVEPMKRTCENCGEEAE